MFRIPAQDTWQKRKKKDVGRREWLKTRTEAKGQNKEKKKRQPRGGTNRLPDGRQLIKEGAKKSQEKELTLQWSVTTVRENNEKNVTGLKQRKKRYNKTTAGFKKNRDGKARGRQPARKKNL